jgi:hypothetical protein
MAQLAVSVEALNDVSAQRCVQIVQDVMLLDELVERQWPVTRDWQYIMTRVLCLADWEYCTWLCKSEQLMSHQIVLAVFVKWRRCHVTSEGCTKMFVLLSCDGLSKLGVRSESILGAFERRCESIRLNSVSSR